MGVDYYAVACFGIEHRFSEEEEKLLYEFLDVYPYHYGFKFLINYHLVLVEPLVVADVKYGETVNIPESLLDITSLKCTFQNKLQKIAEVNPQVFEILKELEPKLMLVTWRD